MFLHRLAASPRFKTTVLLPYALVAFVSGGSVYLLRNNSSPQPFVTGVHEADGLISRGGVIDLVATAYFPPDCDVEISRWLWHWDMVDGNRLRHFYPLFSAPRPPPLNDDSEPETYMISIEVPTSIKSGGEWFYRSQRRNNCQGKSDGPIRSVDIPLRVVDQTTENPATVVVPQGPLSILPEAR